MWVVRTSLASPASVARLVAQARANNFNALFVQVRGRGDAYYRSAIEPRATSLAGQPSSFDPLGDLLTAAHRADIAVHAWVNVNLVASASDLPSSREHVVNQHPEWLMVPRALSSELATVPPRSPAYVATLARWTRGQSSDVEGLFTSPVLPASSAHVAGVITDLVRRYPLDGLHLDYVRYPRDDFDYSIAALREFRGSVVPDLAPAERDRLDARAHVAPLVYVDTFPTRWANFRRSRLTSLVMRIRTQMKSERPAMVLTAAVRPDSAEAAARRLQDWALWAQTGLLDAVCPMAYTPDGAAFARQVSEAAEAALPARLWVGIGAYKLTAPQAAAQIQAARRAGASGYLLFSYDSMVEAGSSDYLAQVGRAALDTDSRRSDGGR
jgi:uncharacterized lipoprotein YddW (UPF0748 family)